MHVCRVKWMEYPIPPDLRHCVALCMQGNVLRPPLLVWDERILCASIPVCFLWITCWQPRLPPPRSDLIANYAVSTSLVTPAVRERLCSRLPARRYRGVILYLWNEAATLCVSSNLRRDGKSPFIEAKRALQTDFISAPEAVYLH